MLLGIRAAAGALLAVALSGAPAFGQAESTLDRCQKVAALEAAKYVANKAKAVTTCLQKISKELIKDGSATPADVAKACAGQFRKLVNSEAPVKTLAAKMQAKVLNACDPGVNAALPHSEGDVLCAAFVPDPNDVCNTVGVAQPLDVRNLGAWCTNFGGDGTLDDIQGWVDCKLQAGDCQADQQASVAYAQVLPWLALIRPEILNLGAEAKYTDAVAAIDAIAAHLDADSNGDPDLTCGPLGVPPVLLLATGQTTPYCSGACVGDDDGELQLGTAAAFTDNGDGTITDDNTGLMWEKKSDDGSIHDVDTTYLWVDAFGFIAALNGATFAGHGDWRLPNMRELQSLTDSEQNNPAAAAIWSTACVGGCSVTACSCIANSSYWTSTTFAPSDSLAWGVDFGDGSVVNLGKSAPRRVRAVRGGL